MKQIEQSILKDAETLIKNINIINDNLQSRDYLDDEDEYMGCDSEIAIEHHNFYDEVVEAVHGFQKFHDELVKRFNGDADAKTWFTRVENAVCWIRFSFENIVGYYDVEDNVVEMYNAYWKLVYKFHTYEEEC